MSEHKIIPLGCEMSDVELKNFYDNLISLSDIEQYEKVLQILDSSFDGYTVPVDNLFLAFKKYGTGDLMDVNKLLDNSMLYADKVEEENIKEETKDLTEKLKIYTDDELQEVKDTMNRIYSITEFNGFHGREKNIVKLKNQTIDTYISVIDDVKSDLIKLKSLNKL